MAETLEQQKSDLCAAIQQATCPQELTVILNNIDFGELQSLLQHYVSNQASPESVDQLHRRTSPLTRYIGTDCLQHTLRFLDFSEMCKLSAINALFRDLLEKEKDRIMNLQLLGHQAFFEFIYSEQNSRDLVTTKFALQKQYDLDDLNQYSFDEMGRRGILEGEDMALWRICGHFGWNKRLFAVYEDDDGTCPFLSCGEKPWCPPAEMNDFSGSFDWKIIDVAGVDESMWWEYTQHDPQLRPILEVECPGKSWWNDFKAQNIKGNLYEQLLRVHPVFKNRKQWDQNSEHLIGYVFHHEYDPAIWKTPLTELGKKNIWKGMDMIIWKLCKHFGFEMSLSLIGDEDYICPFPTDKLEVSTGIVMHNLSPPELHWRRYDIVLGNKIVLYCGCYREEGSSVRNAETAEDSYMGMSIRYNPPRDI